MINPNEQDAEIYARTPGLLDGAVTRTDTPSLEMQQSPQEPSDQSFDIDLDTNSQLLEAILQELRSLNQNIREMM
jgi:hypothetical protein